MQNIMGVPSTKSQDVCKKRLFFSKCPIKTPFPKSKIGWPQQPPTEKVLIFNMIFYQYLKKKVFSKHQNKVEFKNLDDSEVLSSDFPGPRTSAASLPHWPLQPK